MDSESPYQPPQFPAENQIFQNPEVTPAVWPWYVAYTILMALLYVACAIGAVFLIVFLPEVVEEAGDDAWVLRIQGIVMLVFSVPLAILFGAAPFLPRRKWAWIYGFVTIGLGMTSLCCLPASIPLLVFWLKPDTKAWFCGS